MALVILSCQAAFLACFQIVSPEDTLLNGVQVEADYGFNDEGDGEEMEEGQEAEQQVAGEVQAHDPETQDRGGKAQGRAADAPADQEWPGFSPNAPAAEAEPEEELPASSAPHVQLAHQSSIEGLPGAFLNRHLIEVICMARTRSFWHPM